jgi:glycosyltransferase involved in cell wall biosynthesis
MSCSTIIPTIGRDTLARAVNSVLQQDFTRGDFEVIVVNDSGKPLPPADWMQSPQVKIMHTNRHNRSVARNTGAAAARGKYLHFLDDDDWMLPGAFEALWASAESAGQAGWVFGGFLLVNNAGEQIKAFNPPETGSCFVQMMASEWIPLQASWISSKAFFAVDGFASLHSLDGGYEDIDLSRLVAREYDFAHSAEVVAAIRYGDSGSTTNYTTFVKQNRRSREKSLDMPGAFTRLRNSALQDRQRTSYWLGRIVYFYLASFPWYLKQKQGFKAASRLAYALIAFLSALRYVFSSSFWRGALRPHYNLVRATLEEMNKNLYTTTAWER